MCAPKGINHKYIVNLNVTAIELEARVPGSLSTVAEDSVVDIRR
jgi:hypothetical protein